MLARLLSVLLLVLTRDGLLHRFDGHHDTTEPAPRATALAVLDDGRVATFVGGKLIVAGRALRARLVGLHQLAAGAALWGALGDDVVRIGSVDGTPTRLLQLPHLHRLAADGAALFAEADGVIVEVGTDRRWKVAGRPIALAAGAGKLFVATKEGPLWQIDRASGAQHELGLGDWWGTIGLAVSDGQLYAVTVAGKLWRIDPEQRLKTIVSMEGWQGAIDLAVLR